MADTEEDSQLCKLQNEFKKLKVDFNRCDVSSPEPSKRRIEVESVPPFVAKSAAKVTCAKSSSMNKSRSYSHKLTRVLNKLAKKRSENIKDIRNNNNSNNNNNSALRHFKKRTLSEGEFPEPSSSASSSSDECGEIKNQARPENYENEESQNDDITVDELAGYFDTIVHIPKKMSQMAEMMYT